jgi:uncharacterized protein YqjF (DUF2071 family)
VAAIWRARGVAAYWDPRAPGERPFLTAQWRHLAMLNFEVSPDVLRPYVPAGTELDDFDGRTLMSIVGFRFLDTRVLGVAIPFHRHFDEVNLRFYVRRDAPEGRRRAVVFVRELVPRRAIAWTARACYDEPYLAVPMRHRIAMDSAAQGGVGAVAYEWRHGGRWHRLEAATAGPPALPAPGSEAEFVTEHYWGYTAQRDGGCIEYRVAHPQWRVWPATRASLDCDVAALYGAPFVDALSGRPRSAFVAEGSEIAVYAGRRLPTGPAAGRREPSGSGGTRST